MLLVCIFIWLWVTAEQKYLAQYFFVFSIFVVLRFYYFFFSCLWSAFSFFNGWQKNRNILRNILLCFRTFNFKTNNLNEPKTRIDEDTILTLDPDSGKVLSSWGKGMFYMPHGLTIDADGNTYVTDVGLHQVMRVG